MHLRTTIYIDEIKTSSYMIGYTMLEFQIHVLNFYQDPKLLIAIKTISIPLPYADARRSLYILH